MATKSIKQWTILPASPDQVFHAWLDSKEHGDMVQADAQIDSNIGGKFSIWEGSIFGKTLEIDRTKHRIVQDWFSEYDDWPKDQPSKLTVEFVPYKDNQTKVRLWHSHIPAQHTASVAEGWKQYYWQPMKEYFAR